MKRLVALALLFSMSQLMAVTTEQVTYGKVVLDYCHIANYSQEVLCGKYSVYEDRLAAKGRKIDIQFAVIPSITEAKEPDPLVFLAGGPGQGSRDLGAFIPMAFKEIHENRDIILIDQRGMGASNTLACEQPKDQPLSLSEEEQDKLMRDVLTKCLAELDADVTKYTQDLANQDIHEIVIALGYDKINLYGGSWGTRSALLYANQFPEQIRTVIMDGNAPLENKVSLYANEDSERALQALFKDCYDNVECKKAFPMLEQDFNQVLLDFGEKGYEVSMSDANSGKLVTIRLSRNAFVKALIGVLYSPDFSRLIPIIIQQAKKRDFRALSGLMAALGDGGIAMGAQLSVLCSEDYSRISNEAIAIETNKGFARDALINHFTNACSIWPKAPLPEIYSNILSSNIPTLILSGAIDPVTPERWGEKMAELMINSKHLIAANTGHNVAPKGCASKLMDQFIDQGNFENIDGSCLDELTRPTFFIDGNGPSSKVNEIEPILAGKGEEKSND